MRPVVARLCLVLVPALAVGCRPPEEPPADPTEGASSPEVVVSWNARILEAAEAEDGFFTLKGVRTAAMAHVAVHDALAAIDPRYEPYRYEGSAPGADPVVAASEAAFAVATAQYPDRVELWAEERARWSGAERSAEAGDAGTPARRDAARVGREAAASILEDRVADGWDREADYAWHPMGPGVYAEFNQHSGTPEGFVFGAGWAGARPFIMDRPDRFRSPPPPEIGSDAYTRAFDEVKEVGRRESAVRTPDQAHLALWWKEFVEKSHNRLAREMVREEGVGLQEAARLFALLNMGVFDGYVASFDAKFHYNHWRPYTAIRWAEHDGNPATRAEPDWTNLHDHTYAFPSYPSAHGTVCAAAMAAMEDTFGADRPFRMTIREVDASGPGSGMMAMDPPTRSFDDFRQAAEECALSRVYLGIHFRYDSEEGTRLGRSIGSLAVDSLLQPR